MDKGKLFEHGFTVVALKNESFVLSVGPRYDRGDFSEMVAAFTNIQDLMNHLTQDADAFKTRKEDGGTPE